MPKLYACIISPDIKRDRGLLVGVADGFASSIEVIEDGVLFDVSGLERLVGKPDHIARKIVAELKRRNIDGKVAVADTVDTAKLLARAVVCESPSVSKGDTSNAEPSLTRGHVQKTVQPDMFPQLPLSGLDIERDTLNVFSELGLRTIEDLQAVPHDDLVSRYGQQFARVIDVIEQRGRSLITPNVKENKISWNFELNNPVEDFEQLIFLLNHGLERLFAEVKYAGFSAEHVDINLRLRNKTTKSYEIKTLFPTLDRAFWLKLINLRAALDPPEDLIAAVDAVAYFTKPRTDQRGLYAVSRPEPESLLLTVNKLKKLVGEENVGVPVLVNQRLARPFELNADAMPDVSTGNGGDRVSPHHDRTAVEKQMERKDDVFSTSTPPPRGIASEKILDPATARQATPPCETAKPKTFFLVQTEKRVSWNKAAELPESAIRDPRSAILPVIGFEHFTPPLAAEVLVREGRLVYVRTRLFAGHVTNFSGVWKGNSHWWARPWKTLEWDIEIEDGGIYRLCKVDKEWFLLGEYD